MSRFWDIVQSWNDGIGQGIFFLIVISLSYTLIERLFYYLTVMLRGWPSN